MSIEEFGYKDQLHRALTTKDLVIYGLIFMVPIAPYSVFGFVYNDAKGMLPLAYLVGLVGMFFTALSYAAAGMHFAAPETAFYEITQRAGGTWLRLITIIAIVIASAIANAMAAQAAVSRILFAMARDGNLPRVLAKIHPRFKTPYVSTLAVALVSLLVGLLFANRVDDLTLIVNFGALTGFVLLHLSVINHYLIRQRSGDWLRHLIFPVVGLSIIVFVLYEMDRAAKILGLAWIAIGVFYYLLLAIWIRKPAVLKI